MDQDNWGAEQEGWDEDEDDDGTSDKTARKSRGGLASVHHTLNMVEHVASSRATGQRWEKAPEDDRPAHIQAYERLHGSIDDWGKEGQRNAGRRRQQLLL